MEMTGAALASACASDGGNNIYRIGPWELSVSFPEAVGRGVPRANMELFRKKATKETACTPNPDPCPAVHPLHRKDRGMGSSADTPCGACGTGAVQGAVQGA